MDKNTWFTCNIKGDIGVHDVTKAKAEADLEWNRKNYPNEEWEMFNTEEEGGEEGIMTNEQNKVINRMMDIYHDMKNLFDALVELEEAAETDDNPKGLDWDRFEEAFLQNCPFDLNRMSDIQHSILMTDDWIEDVGYFFKNI